MYLLLTPVNEQFNELNFGCDLFFLALKAENRNEFVKKRIFLKYYIPSTNYASTVENLSPEIVK